MTTGPSDWLKAARDAMLCEAESIHAASHRLDGTLIRAIEILLAHTGKIIVSGVGKSGLVGQKIAATLCSTGAPSVFLHPGDALHGDLGVYSPGDPTILISKSGTTAELLRLVPVLREFESPLISILGNGNSPLAQQTDVVLDAAVPREADPCNIAPTSSAVVALAIGDALASALMRARNFTVDDFARFHPGGQLSRNLKLRVQDVMHPSGQIATVALTDSVRHVVIAMTRFPLGAACVIDPESRLLGVITDGDLRRALQQHEDLRPLQAANVMTPRPVTVTPKARLQEALRLMEDRPSQISVLPVVDDDGRAVGLLRIHDIYKGG